MAHLGYWSMQYDPSYLHGWSLGSIRDSDGHRIDGRVFSRGERLSHPDGLTLPLYPFGEERRRIRLPLRAEVQHPGRRTDLSLADSGAPVVSDRLGQVFGEYAGDVELLALTIGEAPEPTHFVLNAARVVDAIDRAKSEIEYWPAGSLGGKSGKPFAVWKLVIRTDVVAGLHCFRLHEWRVELIVSAALMAGIRELNAPEIRFVSV